MTIYTKRFKCQAYITIDVEAGSALEAEIVFQRGGELAVGYPDEEEFECLYEGWEPIDDGQGWIPSAEREELDGYTTPPSA